MSGDLEIRINAGVVTFRAAQDGAGVGTLAGYAAVFNRRSQNLGGFVEQVDPAAFNQSLGDGGPVMARYNHDDNYRLGTTEADTWRVSGDNLGLPYEVDLPDTTSGRDLAVLAARGDVRYSSFAFRTIDASWGVTEDGFPLRTLLAVQLVDVAPVNNPAYRDTSVGMRSLAAATGLSVGDLAATPLEEVRSLLLKDTAERAEQDAEDLGDTRSLLGLRKRALDLDALR